MNETAQRAVYVEILAGETDAELVAVIDAAILRIYERRPEWVDFRFGSSRTHEAVTYKEFLCVAGSVTAHLLSHASKPDGLGRRILCAPRASDSGPMTVYGPDGIEDERSMAEILQRAASDVG